MANTSHGGKPCQNPSIGQETTLTRGGRLSLSDDAANKYMGGQWHMPTKEQIEELFVNTVSAWTAVSYTLNNGTERTVTGATLTSNINGETIFFPAAGHRSVSSSFDVGKAFRVWSSEAFYISTLRSEHAELPDRAWYFFGKQERGMRDNSGGNGSRYLGYSVRGVIG